MGRSSAARPEPRSCCDRSTVQSHILGPVVALSSVPARCCCKPFCGRLCQSPSQSLFCGPGRTSEAESTDLTSILLLERKRRCLLELRKRLPSILSDSQSNHPVFFPSQTSSLPQIYVSAACLNTDGNAALCSLANQTLLRCSFSAPPTSARHIIQHILPRTNSNRNGASSTIEGLLPLVARLQASPCHDAIHSTACMVYTQLTSQ